jgi:hypothetical protein
MGKSPPLRTRIENQFLKFITLIIYLQLGYDKLRLKGMQIMHTHTHHYKIPNGPFEIKCILLKLLIETRLVHVVVALV